MIGKRSGSAPAPAMLYEGNRREEPISFSPTDANLHGCSLDQMPKCSGSGLGTKTLRKLQAASRLFVMVIWANPKSRAALARLPGKLGAPNRVMAGTASTDCVRRTFCRKKAASRGKSAVLNARPRNSKRRRGFTPHAIIQTERTVPSQITICGLTGGVGRWLMIRLDDLKPPITFVCQALAVIPAKVRLGSDGRQYVIFFGEAFGFIINYSPVKALRCNLSGEPLEFLPSSL